MLETIFVTAMAVLVFGAGIFAWKLEHTGEDYEETSDNE